MKSHILCLPAIIILAFILIINGTCAAFPPKAHKIEVPLSLAFRKGRMDNTDLSLSSKSSSSKYSDFSPDTNSQRKYHHHWQQQQHSLNSAIPMEYDVKADSRIGRVVLTVDTVRNSFLGPLTVLKQPSLEKHKIKHNNNRVVASTGAIRMFGVSTETTKKRREKLDKVDLVAFMSYFCNIVVLSLTLVTIPAIAHEYNLSSQATATFCASMAGVAPLGGFVGKLVNGFVCQHLGGQRSSAIYLLGLSWMIFFMSFSRSLASVGLFLFGLEFLGSIQWVAASSVLRKHYRKNPKLMSRGITLLSISSTMASLATKCFGSLLLNVTDWRTTSRVGALTALLGATVMFFGGGDPSSQSVRGVGKGNNTALGATMSVSDGGQQHQSPLASLKIVLGNPIFWMVGIGHSIGFLAKSSDRLLAPFLEEVGGISSSMAVGLTSSVTIGFVLGLYKVSVFRKLKSVKGKMRMIRNGYIASVLSTVGLAACGMKGVSNLVGGSATPVIAAITIFSGMIASSMSFQFYQIPNMMASTVFPERSSVALSLVDAIGFLTTSFVMGLNSFILGNFGWSATWAFLAIFFSFGGFSMTRALRPIVTEMTKSQ